MFRSSFATLLLGGISILYLTAPIAAQEVEEIEDAVAVFNQAQDLHEKGDLAGAVKLYDKAIMIEPLFPEAEYQRGIARLVLGKTSEAERSFRRAVELRSDWTLAMTSLGSLLVQTDQTAEAEKLLAKVIAIEPLNPPALTALVELRLKSKTAPDVYEGLLSQISVLTGKANPTASLWTARAALENALGQRVPARLSLNNALTIDPKNRPALFLTADIEIADGNIEKARAILARLENGLPDSDPIKYLRANVYAYDGKLDAALAQLNSIKSTYPGADGLLNRINASRTTSPVELEKVLAGKPKEPMILGRLCSMYRKDDPAKALVYCRRASEAEPGNMNHAVGFGAALVQAKEYDSAVEILKKILEIVPDNLTARANLATALFQLKRFTEAKTEFQLLTKAEPKSAGAYLFLAIIHDQSTEYLDAMENYQQYLRLAAPAENMLDIEKVNLRLPPLQKLIKGGKGKKYE